MSHRFATCLLAAGVLSSPLEAVASITLNPSRIIFEEGEREATVLLYNRGNVPATYRLSTITYRMTREGKFDLVTDKDASSREKLARKMIRFSPRQVELEPNLAQTVRVMIRRPANLPAGEYLTFLRFTEVPSSKPAPRTVRSPDGKKKVGISLSAIYGVSIPVIIRQGPGGAEAKVTNMGLRPTPRGRAIQFDLERDGLHSVYGDFEVRYQPKGELESFTVGTLTGVSVLPPLSARQVTIGLAPPPERTLGRGLYEVIFTDYEDKSGRELARGSLPVP